MSWLFPGFLAAGLVVGLPVLLHFLRSKPKQLVHFPSLRFLGPSALRDTRRHQLRRWLTLLLRCLIIALLAAAFARPFFSERDAAQRQVMVVAVDNSMSMQAGKRWADQKAWALQQLAELEAGDSAGILLMHPTPTWLAPVATDLARTRALLEAAEPGFEKTRFAGALRQAGSTLATHPSGKKTLVWMTDQQRLGWQGVQLDEPLPPGIQLRLSEFSPASDTQAGIVSARLIEGNVDVTVRLFTPAWGKRQLTISSGTQVLATQAVSLVAGENKFTLLVDMPEGAAGLKVALNADDLAADDTAWIAPPAPISEAAVLSDDAGQKGNSFVAHALNSTRLLPTDAVAAVQFPAGEWPANAVAILRGAQAFTGSNAPHLERFVTQGGALCLFLEGADEQLRWLEARGLNITRRPPPTEETPWHLRDFDMEHPAFSAFAGGSVMPLMEVEFSQGFDLEGEGLTPLARWDDGKVALAEWKGAGTRILIAGFGLTRDSTNWPLQPTFVPFLHGATKWLLSLNRTRTDWHVGDTIPLTGDGIWRTIESPRKEAERKVSGSIRPSAPGLYEFVSGTKKQVFAVNVPPEESDLSPWPRPAELAALQNANTVNPQERHQTSAPPLSDELSETQQRLWWWLLAFCVLALFGELALANRTSL
jgi:hypothetical protein